MDLKETKELIAALKKLVSELEKDSQDGKLTVFEILGNYPEVLAVIQEGKDIKTITAELKDLDFEEIKDLTGELLDFVGIILKIVTNLNPKDEIS